MKLITSLLILLLTVFSQLANAQEQVEMADQMRADGKIYVVVAALTIIMIGLLLYMMRLDKKISGLERAHQAKVGKGN
jgi:uncharacterized membrane protein YqhA